VVARKRLKLLGVEVLRTSLCGEQRILNVSPSVFALGTVAVVLGGGEEFGVHELGFLFL